MWHVVWVAWHGMNGFEWIHRGSHLACFLSVVRFFDPFVPCSCSMRAYD